MPNLKKIYFWRSKFDKIYSFVVDYLFGGDRIRQIAIKDLKLKEGDTVLDLACGSGKNFKYIINKIGKKGKLIGIDDSKEMCNLAKKLTEKNRWENIELIQKDASELNYINTFDATICTFGLTVIPKWKKALNNLIKATKKEGEICIVDEIYTKDYFGFFNWFVWIDSKLSGAQPKRKILQEIKNKLKNIKVKKFLFGTILIVVGNKK